ncbi:MAG: glycerol kinase, partial [Chloroflexia bacterium]|nr:glycerol kinase [Chloroflexia bacterium]
MTDTKLILAIDQGTTSSRAVLIDRHGSSVGMVQQEISQHYPQAGWVNHDASEIWDVTLHVTREVIASAGVSPANITAIGITNQRETTVLWDRATGRP